MVGRIGLVVKQDRSRTQSLVASPVGQAYVPFTLGVGVPVWPYCRHQEEPPSQGRGWQRIRVESALGRSPP